MSQAPEAVRIGGGPLGAIWRQQQERRQQDALPDGRVLLTCSAPLGKGGLGRHLEEMLAALDRGGRQARCLCGTPTGLGSGGLSTRAKAVAALAAATLARPSPAWRCLLANVHFDASAAGAGGPGEHLIAFGGQSLEQLRSGRSAGCRSVSLVSATTHARAVSRSHRLAHNRHPIEPSWAGRLTPRSLAEYGQADRIYVSSRYVLESFVEHGVAEESLSLFPLTPARRFYGAANAEGTGTLGRSHRSSTFDVVYVGGLSVVKGVPLLIEAFSRLPHPDMRLLLVGGPETRPMRRYLQQACARDRRVVVAPGDPLPVLRAARLYVHPSYSDGFGYAPAEALACGLPVIVSEDTGMKELIATSGAGLILPTGDLDALTEAIESAYRREIAVAPSAGGQLDAKR